MTNNVGASTKPGMFTQPFGKIKGQAELRLVELQDKAPSLKVYCPRPGFVDPTHDPKIKEALATRKAPAIERFLPVYGPLFRLLPNHVSPTVELGKVLVDLALSDGKELQGEGVERGRILEPAVLRRLYKESTAAAT